MLQCLVVLLDEFGLVFKDINDNDFAMYCSRFFPYSHNIRATISLSIRSTTTRSGLSENELFIVKTNPADILKMILKFLNKKSLFAKIRQAPSLA